MSDTPCRFWLGKLSNLNTGRARNGHVAPHKPLMFLTVLDLIENGDVADGWVKFDVRLVSRFRDYWELVLDRQHNAPDIPMPFHALGGDKIWERFTADGAPSVAKGTTRLCRIDPALFACLLDASFRRKVRETLVTLYFTAAEQVILCARFRLPIPKTVEISALRERAADFKASQKKGRDSRFKSDVLGGYYFTCALTGYRLDTETTSIVQAAHIEQHAISGNDDPQNGLALTPDAHWMFDQGLWTAIPKGRHFIIKIATDRFTESSPHGRRLADRDGKPLCFHEHARLRPSVESLARHANRHRF